MSHTQYSIDGAVKRSSVNDEIVTVVVDDIQSAFADLIATVEDYDYVDTTGQDNEPLREVWDASHDDGSMDWRVHLLMRDSND